MAGISYSSSVFARSAINPLSSQTCGRPQDEVPATRDISALPFIINGLETTLNSFLHFSPGAFNHQGTILGGGATFSVEQHGLKGKHGSLMVDPFSSATDFRGPEFVAVKKVRQISTNPDDVVRGIERELIILRLLHGSKNILKLIGVGWEPSPVEGNPKLWPVMVTEIADMGSLDAVQRKMGALHYSTKRKFCLDVANGLSALHQQRMTHGDVKPENVLIFSDEKEGYIAKLSDFAFSSTVAQLQVGRETPPALDNDHEFSVVGATALWAPPEFRKPGTFQSLASRDVYSWAMLVVRVVMDGKFPPKNICVEDEDELKTSHEDLLGDHRFVRFPADVKATLERRPHNTDIRAHLPDLRTDFKPEPDSSNTGDSLSKSEAARSPADSLNLLKASGRTQLVRYCIRLIKKCGESDVQADVATLGQVLRACVDLEPEKRSLSTAVRAWGSQLIPPPRPNQPYEGPVNNYYPLYYPSFRRWPLRLQSQFVAEFKHLISSESPYPDGAIAFCPIRSMNVTCAQVAMEQGDREEAISASKLIATQATRGDPHSMGLEARLAKVLSLEFGIDDAENLDVDLKARRLIQAIRAGSHAAQISFMEQFKGPADVAADLLRDLLAAQYHGTRQQTCIISAMRGSREESDLALIKAMAPSNGSRNAFVAWSNSFTYPGDERHERILHIACSRGFEKIVRYLVESGADIDLEDVMGETPLLHACRAGRTEVTRYLLQKGASVRPSGPCAETPLHWLCSFPIDHMEEIAGLLVRAGADLGAMAKHKSAKGDSLEQQQFSFAAGTPLHRAVSRLSYKAVDCLLQLGASPTLKSSSAPFYSPLSLACSMNLSVDSSANQTRIVQLTMTPGLRYIAKSERRRSANRICVGNLGDPKYLSSDFVSEKSILKRLLEACKPTEMNQLHLQPFDARRLLDIALEVDPLLRISVHGGHWRLASRQTVRLLWHFGEDLIDKQAGFSSFHMACNAGNFEAVEEMIRLLPASSLNMTMPGRSAFIQAPLHYAIRGGHERISKLLLDRGADPKLRFMTESITINSAPKSGIWSMLDSDYSENSKAIGFRSTLLHTCATSGSAARIVEDLIRRGVKVNSYDSNWQSPLYVAIRACNFEVADVLLKHGARLNELRDDLTIFGQLAEEGFSSPVASFEYILNKLKPKDSAAFMANFKQSLTVFHKLMDSEGSQRNLAWSEQLFLVFLRYIPDKRILDVQADGTADTALHVAIRNNNLLGVRLLLNAGANPNLANCSDGLPLDLANKLRPQLLTEFPKEIMDDPHAVAEYESRRGLILRTIAEKGGKWLRDPAKMFSSRLFAGLKSISPELAAELGEEKYSMPRWAERNWFELRVQLGVDLKTVLAKETYYEGAIREIIEDIVEDLRPLFSRRSPEFLTNPQDVVVKVLAEHISKCPEIFHRALRVSRFESQMAWMLSGFSGFSLSHDPKEQSVSIQVPLEDDGSGQIGIPNLIKRGDRSYEQSTQGTRIISFPRGVGGGVSFTTSAEEGEDSIEEIMELMKRIAAR